MNPDADAELVSPYWRVDDAGAELRVRDMCRRLPATARAVGRIVARADPRGAATILLLQTASGIATAFGLLAVGGVLDGLLAAGPTAARVTAALPALAALVAAYVLRATAETVVAYLHVRVRPAVRRLAEDELFRACLRVDLAAFDEAAFYDRMHRARDRGVYHVERAVDNLVAVVGAALAVAAASVSLAVLHPALLPVLVLGVLPEGWAVLRSARLMHRHVMRTTTLNRRVRMITDLAAEHAPAAEIRACQAQEFLVQNYVEVADPLRDLEIRVGVGQVRIQAVGRILAAVATGATFVVLGVLLLAGWIPLAVAGAAVFTVRTANGALAGLVVAARQLLEQGLYVSDFQHFLADAAARTRAPEPPPQPPPQPPLQPPPQPASGPMKSPATIAVEDVWFRYPGAPVQTAALRGVSLTIPAGRTIALVGENGSGKTTLAKVLAGLYTPTSGRIYRDGVDLSTMDPEVVADGTMMVMQNPIRWPHTARANVRAGRHDRVDPDDRALLAAAALAGADSVVAGLPAGWDTLLSAYYRDGVDLSGGQWQRLAVARGLFRDAPLLIWDEPTAPLDARAEYAVYESLRRLARDRTVVLITHRLASIRHADRIYLLHAGALVEEGTHDELIAVSGRYAEMYALQERMYATTAAA